MQQRANPILQVKDLSVFFKNSRLISDITFSLQRESIVAIIGASGSGKTTLLRTINRLTDEDRELSIAGDILFHGRSIYQTVPKYLLRRKIGFVFQRPTIFPISVKKNVLFGLHHLNLTSKKNYSELCEQYLREAFLWDEVKDRLNESALKLSVGQQQRLAIARTLAVQPEILLLDEPTSALDERSTEEIENLLRNLSRSKSILLVTHSVEQAKSLSRDVVVLKPSLNGGEMKFFGGLQEFNKLSSDSIYR